MLAQAIGSLRESITYWESGRVTPSQPYRERIAELTKGTDYYIHADEWIGSGNKREKMVVRRVEAARKRGIKLPRVKKIAKRLKSAA